MKRRTAKEILADSFRELAESKAIDRITVKDITDHCGYSPATFYRQFTDKYDLIAWDYSRGVSGIMQRISEDHPWEHALFEAALSFGEQKEYLANLFTHTGGQDSFIRYMTEINYDLLKDHILKANGFTELSEETDMYIRIYCLGTVSLTCEWVLGKYTASPRQLAEIFRKSLPSPLHDLLYR